MKTMKCDTVRELMFDYIEWRRGKEENAEQLNSEAESSAWHDFERHIEMCEECKRELSECEEMLMALKNSAENVPDSLHGDIMARIRFDAKLRRRNIFSKVFGGVAAVFVLFVGVTVLLRSGAFDVATDGAANGEDLYNGKSECESPIGNTGGNIYGDGIVDGTNDKDIIAPEDGRDDMAEVETSSPEACDEPETPETVLPASDADADEEAPAEDEADAPEYTFDRGIEIFEDYLSSSSYDGGIAFIIEGEGKYEAYSELKDKFSGDIAEYGENYFVISTVTDEKELTAIIEDITEANDASVKTASRNGRSRCVFIAVKK